MRYLIRRHVKHEFAFVDAANIDDVFAQVLALGENEWTKGYNDYMVEVVDEAGCCEYNGAACDIEAHSTEQEYSDHFGEEE